ncbi:MAG: UDP-N-acetylglucosamine--N-acetylmuramyl-(pentapeptide) pyrophosphoryl-undecaprenol N-acetylglucosamine transferase, partial [Patescibacteria group bacterium]
MANIRILLAGGGTGGHMYPLIAVAKEIQRQTPFAEIAYAGNPGRFDIDLKAVNIKILKLATAKWRRYFSLLNFLDIPKFFWSLAQAFWKIYWFMPDAIFSKGGPGALPAILACRFYLVPIVIHESDTVPGMTTMIAAKQAKKIFLAFGEAEKYFEKADVEVVGQPVREEILNSPSKNQTRKQLGFTEDLPLVLFIGGSQGSERLNDFVIANLGSLLQNYQVLHQAGENNYREYAEEYEVEKRRISPSLLNHYKVVPYFNNDSEISMTGALAAAEVIVSRAGAGAIFEIAASGKPAILIPLPESARNHQESNAYAYQKTGAAVLIEEENLL